jgi:hypothetical protein
VYLVLPSSDSLPSGTAKDESRARGSGYAVAIEIRCRNRQRAPAEANQAALLEGTVTPAAKKIGVRRVAVQDISHREHEIQISIS